MKLSVTKISNASVGVYVTMGNEKPILLHRVVLHWIDKTGNTFGQNVFRPDQFIEENIGILVASMPIMGGAAKVKATANYEVIGDVALTSTLAL